MLTEYGEQRIRDGISIIQKYRRWGHSYTCASVSYIASVTPWETHRVGGVPDCKVTYADRPGAEGYEGRHRKNG